MMAGLNLLVMERLMQISKAVGATVIAVCRGAAKAEALRRLGADEVIDQSADNSPLRAQIKVFPLHTSSTMHVARQPLQFGWESGDVSLSVQQSWRKASTE